MKHKTCLMCAALLLIALPIVPPAHALIASSEIKQKAFKAEWDLERQRQRFASKCLAYHRPNEAAWDAYLKRNFRYIPIPAYYTLWRVWRQYQAPFLDDEILPLDDPIADHLRDELIKRIIELGGYDIYIEDWDNYQRIFEDIHMFEELNVLWDEYEHLTGIHLKNNYMISSKLINIMFNVEKMKKAIEEKRHELAKPKGAEAVDD